MLRARWLQVRSYIMTHHLMHQGARRVLELLKVARDDPQKLELLVSENLKGMVKEDLVCLYKHLLMEDEADLALKVLQAIGKEPWGSSPKVIAYKHLAKTLARKGKFRELEGVVADMESRGLKFRDRVPLELAGHCIDGGAFELALRVLKGMRNKPRYFEPIVYGLNAAGQYELSLRLEEQADAATYYRPREGSEIHSLEPWAS